MRTVAATSPRFEANRPHIVDEMIDGEVVAINVQTGSYYSLRGSAAEVWAALDGQATLDEMVQAMAEQNGDPTRARETLEAFIAELEREGLTRPLAGNGSVGGQHDRPAFSQAASEPPKLEKFTDMEDLLLLDPVHDVDARGWPHAQPQV